MPRTTAYDLTDEEVTELDPLNADKPAETSIGLPDLPGKSLMPEYEMNISDHPPDGSAPDSLTGAVMENLRVGAGINDRNDEEADQAAESAP
ncbi:MAG: hypothetical protein U0Z53_08015 [Blastocatellia bacterium]